MEGRGSARLESLEHVYMPKGSRAESREEGMSCRLVGVGETVSYGLALGDESTSKWGVCVSLWGGSDFRKQIRWRDSLLGKG